MAILHQATITPTKAELITDWLPRQPWFDGPNGPATPLGAYRFDDPAGHVGIEAHLVEVAGRIVHVPLTYRGAPLEGGQAWLVGTTEHSVLGTRWVYDAIGDPVYRDELVRVVREGDTQVDLVVETPDGPQRREPSMHVRGSGEVDAGAGAEIAVVRDLTDVPVDAEAALIGTWPGRAEPAALARVVGPGLGDVAIR